MSATVPQVLTAPQLLAHYQEHRRLTRRVIEAFPADQINTFTIGGMRTFGALVQEMLGMPVPTLVGMTTGSWETAWATAPEEKAALLARWDAQTPEIDRLWALVRPEARQEVMNAFGYYEGPAINIFFYVLDNEVHHRGQGYVYLRALGIEPPPFHVRD